MVRSAAGAAMEKAPSWFERILLPQLSEIKGQLTALNAKMDSLRNELKSDIARVDQRVDGLEKRMDDRFSGMEKRMEDQFSNLEKRLDVVRELDDLKTQFAEFRASR
ncbi:MAG: hypothetical protein KGJ23_09640 [Euryarchaeota archaeon]|nr:hypothetical protein [Euryarchaeota archaeon]MDE1836864.1 hypothetical protein [Euryarchaeota archaeon]MDE1879743.1 hypothetical protein [Euryarchaeota archaeon]MDE2046034.1 hypothetical protein [Thermoplasmata archaeon]